MAVSSKFRELSLPYNCYETIHTWSPFCSVAILSLGYYLFTESIKVYGPLYLATQIIQRKYSLKAFLRTIQNTLTSMSFIAFNGIGMMFFLCLSRRLTGKIYYHCAYLCSFVGGFLAIFIERESRRRSLAIYTSNLASESIFRILVSRGKIKPIRNGEVYLFSAAMAALIYVMRKQRFADNFISTGLSYVLGKDDTKSLTNSASSEPIEMSQCTSGYSLERGRWFLDSTPSRSLYARQKQLIRNLWNYVKHESCPHKTSCLHYVLQGFVRPFAMGYLAHLSLRCLISWNKLFSSRSLILKLLADSLNFGIFIAGFGGTFRLINCFLRWIFGRNSDLYVIPAALFGGFFMNFFPSSSLALYFTWKAIEVAYLAGIKEGVLPEVNGFIPLLYAASTGVVLHVAILEAHNLKPSYLRFILRVSGNKMGEINRTLLDHFGVQSSKHFCNFWPELDFRYTSRALQENMLQWMIP